MEVTPFPVDFQVSAGGIRSAIDFLHTPKTLNKTELAWREIIGRLFYYLVG